MNPLLVTNAPSRNKKVISRGLILYRLAFSKVVLFSLLLSIVVFIPRLIADVIGHNFFTQLDILSVHRLWMIAIDVAALIFFIAILWHMHCVLRDKHEPLVEDVATGLKYVWSVLLAALLQCAIMFAFSYIIAGVMIMMGYFHILFSNSLPGIIFTTLAFFTQAFLLIYIATLFIFVIPLIAIERRGIIRAIEGSILLVWNHWWRVFSVQVTPWIFYCISLVLIKYLAHIDVHIYFTNKTGNQLTSTIVNIIIFALFIPWVAANLLTQLKDLELRKRLEREAKSTSI